MSYNKLSADPIALLLGILSLVIVFLGCCCGLLVGVSLILGIVGLVLANKSLNEYDQNPEAYSHQSRKNVYAGKVVSLIGTIISGIYLLIAMVFFVFYQASFASMIKDKVAEVQHKEQQQDSLNHEKEYEEINNEKDTTYTDSITIEEIKK